MSRKRGAGCCRWRLNTLRVEIYTATSPRSSGYRSRAMPADRTTLDYLSTIFTRFIALHGDRRTAATPPSGGWARSAGVSVMVIGNQKGREDQGNIKRKLRYGAPRGYARRFG